MTNRNYIKRQENLVSANEKCLIQNAEYAILPGNRTRVGGDVLYPIICWGITAVALVGGYLFWNAKPEGLPEQTYQLRDAQGSENLEEKTVRALKKRKPNQIQEINQQIADVTREGDRRLRVYEKQRELKMTEDFYKPGIVERSHDITDKMLEDYEENGIQHMRQMMQEGANQDKIQQQAEYDLQILEQKEKTKALKSEISKKMQERLNKTNSRLSGGFFGK